MVARVFLTAFGSAYYHCAPESARLLWDRLQMTIVFMTVFTMVVAERFPGGMRLLLPLAAIGIASVPMLMLLLPKSNELWWVILFYGHGDLLSGPLAAHVDLIFLF